MVVNPNQPEPYRSAFDLPTVVEMREQLKAMKFFTLFIARDQRKTARELEKQLEELFGRVDRFYDVLKGRNWIFTDDLPTDEVGALLDSSTAPEIIEAGLVEIIAEQVRGRFWQMGLFGHAVMRARRSQVERAREHYVAEQWDSCALVLVAVMDGFVNDAEPAERRGLHTREADEMVAWDSLVGHHMGLTSVMPTFRKTIKKRVDDEVFELYRNGIVHGNVVNYSNQIVATKAWNMLHAVVDWATATAKAAIPPEPKPTWKGITGDLAQHARDKSYREDYKAWSASADDANFADLDVVRSALGFLNAWKAKQWGLVVGWMPPSFVKYRETAGERAVFAKETYEGSPLVEFDLTAVSSDMASAADVSGTATIGDKGGPFHMRWVLVNAEGDIAGADQTDARWVLGVFPPHTFMKD